MKKFSTITILVLALAVCPVFAQGRGGMRGGAMGRASMGGPMHDSMGWGRMNGRMGAGSRAKSSSTDMGKQKKERKQRRSQKSQQAAGTAPAQQ